MISRFALYLFISSFKNIHSLINPARSPRCSLHYRRKEFNTFSVPDKSESDFFKLCEATGKLVRGRVCFCSHHPFPPIPIPLSLHLHSVHPFSLSPHTPPARVVVRAPFSSSSSTHLSLPSPPPFACPAKTIVDGIKKPFNPEAALQMQPSLSKYLKETFGVKLYGTRARARHDFCTLFNKRLEESDVVARKHGGGGYIQMAHHRLQYSNQCEAGLGVSLRRLRSERERCEGNEQ